MIETRSGKARATLSGIVAAIHDRTLADVIAGLGDDVDQQVRAAATWSVTWMNGAVPQLPSEHRPAVLHDHAITPSTTVP